MALLQISEPGESPAPHQRKLAVGIDLGTTNSLVAAVRSSVAEVLPDAQDVYKRQQHDHGVGRRGLQGGQHAVEVQAAGGGVVVGIGADFETGAFEQRAMVFPAGIADQDLGGRQQLAQEVGADLERAGAAQGLGGQDAAGGDQRGILADQQGLRALVVAGDAFDRQVACLLYTSLHHPGSGW